MNQLEHVFRDLGMRTVFIETSEYNANAFGLFERIGFQKVGVVPRDRTVWHEGKWILSGSVIMEKVKEERDCISFKSSWNNKICL